MLNEALASSLSIANLINRNQEVVVPSSTSVAYAILNKGGNLDAAFNAIVSTIYCTACLHTKFSYYCATICYT